MLNSIARGWAVSAVVFAVCVCEMAEAQSRIDLMALLRDTQQINSESRRLTMAWWIPTEYWRGSLESAGAPPEKAKEILKLVNSALMIAVVDGTFGPLGALIFRAETSIRSATRVLDASGREYAPLEPAALDPNLQNLAAMLRPTLANALGRMGENMNIMFFPIASADGKRIAEADTEGSFTVVVDGREFTYRTPLASLLPRKVDPATKETFPGNFRFNPYTGAPLSIAPLQTEASPIR